MAFPDSPAPFVAVLLCDIINTFVRSGINIINGPSQGRSIAAIVSLCLMTAFTFVVFLIVNIYKSDQILRHCLNFFKDLWSYCFNCFKGMCCCSSSCCSNNNERSPQYDQLGTQGTSLSLQEYQSTDNQRNEITSEPTNTETNGQTNEQLNEEAKEEQKKKDKKELVLEIIIILFSVLSVLSYFVGDNLTPLMQIYGEHIGCSGKCIRNIRTISIVLLVFSLLLRSSLFCQPIKIFVKPKVKEEKIPGKTIAKTFVFMYKMDTIYTAFALAVESCESCDPEDLIITGCLIGLCVIAGIISIWIKGILACTKYKNPQSNSDAGNIENVRSKEDIKNENKKKCIIVFMCILLSIAFPLYLLFDNEMPMDCAFNCGPSTANNNSTANDNCQVHANYGTRTFVMGIVAVSVSVAQALNYYYKKHFLQKSIDFSVRD